MVPWACSESALKHQIRELPTGQTSITPIKPAAFVVDQSLLLNLLNTLDGAPLNDWINPGKPLDSPTGHRKKKEHKYRCIRY